MATEEKPDQNVDYTLEISTIETRLAELKMATERKPDQELDYAHEISEIQSKLSELERSEIQTRLAELKSRYPNLSVVVLLFNDGTSDVFTDVEFMKLGKSPWRFHCLPPGYRWQV